MNLEPKGLHDLEGWRQVSCFAADTVRREDLTVGSSRTNMDPLDTFTEWWWELPDHFTGPAPAVPVLREYRSVDGCRHYLVDDVYVAARRVEE